VHAGQVDPGVGGGRRIGRSRGHKTPGQAHAQEDGADRATKRGAEPAMATPSPYVGRLALCVDVQIAGWMVEWFHTTMLSNPARPASQTLRVAMAGEIREARTAGASVASRPATRRTTTPMPRSGPPV